MIYDLKSLILEHIKRRPETRVQDIYKLLYQGVFGVDHIVTERAFEILAEESNRVNLDEHSEDPLLEDASPDGSIIRVNLRQYIKCGGDLETLYNVMKESAKVKGNPEVFHFYWSKFKKMVLKGIFTFPIDEIKKLDDLIENEGIKPQHHTESYRTAYYPAYRVVLKKIFVDKIFRE